MCTDLTQTKCNIFFNKLENCIKVLDSNWTRNTAHSILYSNIEWPFIIKFTSSNKCLMLIVLLSINAYTHTDILRQWEIITYLSMGAHVQNKIWYALCSMLNANSRTIHSLHITINETNKTINTFSIGYCLRIVSRAKKRKQLCLGWCEQRTFFNIFVTAMCIKHY